MESSYETKPVTPRPMGKKKRRNYNAPAPCSQSCHSIEVSQQPDMFFNFERLKASAWAWPKQQNTL